MLESPSQSQSRYGSFDAHREIALPEKPKKAAGQQMHESVRQFAKAIDRIFPNYATPDAMAFSLAKQTPRMLVVALVLLVVCIGGSLAHVGAADFLWGIPSLGSLGIGFGLWICTSNLTIRSGLSGEARETAQAAMRLQWGIIGASALTLVYFLGMATQIW